MSASKSAPAFPTHPLTETSGPGYTGMTLHHYFAAAALKGLLANPKSGENPPKKIVETAVLYADELAKQLGL